MDILDALDEIKHMNTKKSKVTHEQLLTAALENQFKRLNAGLDPEEEDAVVSQIFKNARMKRLEDDVEEENDAKSDDSTRAPSIANFNGNNNVNEVISGNPEEKPKQPEKKGLGLNSLKIIPVKRVKVSTGNDPNVFAKIMTKATVSHVTNGAQIQSASCSQSSQKVLVQARTNLNLCNYSDDE